MPMYAFRCLRCEHEFEDLVPRYDDLAPCPQCGSERVTRLLTAPADYRGSQTASTTGGCDGPGCGLPPCPGGSCGIG